ncbi:FYN-binding protein 1-like [Platichthys flesus]|uniref:FYN-binding protein 1-like n=1 Tax=Platichthys flesus TaxID=8260 RepID=UPI002DB793AB|nr:FYN-binding protein 1-like [Platichthys flesus]
MPGSTIKTCISCRQQIAVACKICKLCGARQQMKKALQKATEKASKQWGAKLKKDGNTSKLVDAARVLVHKFKMAGLHPILLFGTNKRGSVSCDYLNGLEVVKDTETASVVAVRSLYKSLLSVIVRREKANNLNPVDPERPRELAESHLHQVAKEEEDEKTFSLFLTACDPEPTAPATAPSTSHSPPGQSYPSSSPSLPLFNSKESCQPKYPDTQSNGLVKGFDSNSSEPGTSTNPHGAGLTKRRLCQDELEEIPSKRQTKGQTSSDSDMDLFAPLESDIDESANSVPEQQSSDLTPPAMVVNCPQVVKEEEEEKKDEGSSPDQHTAGPSVPLQSSPGSTPSVDQSKPLSPPGSPPCTSLSSSKAPPEPICVSSPPHPVEPPSDPEPRIDSQTFWKSCNAAGCTQAIFTDFINEMNDIAGRIQSDQASEDDCNHALNVMAASGKLEEIVAKQQKELQRKQQELMKAAATMQQVILALRR